MQAYFKKISQYFESLVAATPKVSKFISVSQKELHQVLSTSEPGPFLVLFGFEGKLDGNNQRTIGTRTISFCIVFKVADPNNYKDQYDKVNEAEEIGLQFLARINQDAHATSTLEWLRGAFKKDSVKFSEITLKTGHGLFGCEFHFDLELTNPLIADSNFWTDKDFC